MCVCRGTHTHTHTRCKECHRSRGALGNTRHWCGSGGRAAGQEVRGGARGMGRQCRAGGPWHVGRRFSGSGRQLGMGEGYVVCDDHRKQNENRRAKSKKLPEGRGDPVRHFGKPGISCYTERKAIPFWERKHPNQIVKNFQCFATVVS